MIRQCRVDERGSACPGDWQSHGTRAGRSDATGTRGAVSRMARIAMSRAPLANADGCRHGRLCHRHHARKGGPACAEHEGKDGQETCDGSEHRPRIWSALQSGKGETRHRDRDRRRRRIVTWHRRLFFDEGLLDDVMAWAGEAAFGEGAPVGHRDGPISTCPRVPDYHGARLSARLPDYGRSNSGKSRPIVKAYSQGLVKARARAAL